MKRFTLRDLLWFVTVIAAALGGWCWREGEVTFQSQCADEWMRAFYREARHVESLKHKTAPYRASDGKLYDTFETSPADVDSLGRGGGLPPRRPSTVMDCNHW